MRRIHALWLLPVLGGAGCSRQDSQPSIGSLTQAVRAGIGTQGDIYLGADLLVTDTDGSALPCDASDVTFTVEVSRNGVDGPYATVEEARVYRACSSPAQGELALVLDNSQSLRGELSTLEDAAERVVDTVVGRGGRLSLTRVSTNSRVLTPLTDDPQQLAAGIQDMFISNGWTALYDGIRMASQTLAEPQASGGARFDDARQFCDVGGKRGIVVFTDSAENNSSHQMHWSEDYPGDGVDTTLEDVRQLKVGSESTPIYTVGLGDDADHEALSSLAQATGGRHVALDDEADVGEVLAMLAEYGESAHRVCTQLPDHICGSLDVRIGHSYNDGENLVEGSTVQHLELPCPVRAEGRVVTVLLTLAATGQSDVHTTRLMAQSVNWVSPVDAPKVLFVRDDFHHGEFAEDTERLHRLLLEAGYDTDMIEEPEQGVALDQLEGYDVVWFSNPGYPMDDILSLSSLRQFSAAGGGVVLQGDDMSRGHALAFSLSPLTRLDYVDNGTSYCGQRIDNGTGGNYLVEMNESDHPILAGLSGQAVYYGDDIDTTVLASPQGDPGVEVLAWASVEGDTNCPRKPVLIAYSPNATE